MDVQRVKTLYIEDVFRTLDWLGIDWDEGPFSVADQQKFSQSLRMDRYRELLSDLEKGGFLFACDCSRSQIQTVSTDGGYPGTCLHKNLSLKLPRICIRCKSDSLNEIVLKDLSGSPSRFSMPSDMKFSILRRKDGLPSYQICSLADDIDDQINYIIRGNDLLGSSIFQSGVASLLGFKDFSSVRFFHHPLLQDEQGRKLSKSAGSISLQHLRAQKGSLEQLLADFSKWIGLPERAVDTADLLAISRSVADGTTRLVPT